MQTVLVLSSVLSPASTGSSDAAPGVDGGVPTAFVVEDSDGRAELADGASHVTWTVAASPALTLEARGLSPIRLPVGDGEGMATASLPVGPEDRAEVLEPDLRSAGAVPVPWHVDPVIEAVGPQSYGNTSALGVLLSGSESPQQPSVADEVRNVADLPTIDSARTTEPTHEPTHAQGLIPVAGLADARPSPGVGTQTPDPASATVRQSGTGQDMTLAAASPEPRKMDVRIQADLPGTQAAGHVTPDAPTPAMPSGSRERAPSGQQGAELPVAAESEAPWNGEPKIAAPQQGRTQPVATGIENRIELALRAAPLATIGTPAEAMGPQASGTSEVAGPARTGFWERAFTSLTRPEPLSALGPIRVIQLHHSPGGVDPEMAEGHPDKALPDALGSGPPAGADAPKARGPVLAGSLAPPFVLAALHAATWPLPEADADPSGEESALPIGGLTGSAPALSLATGPAAPVAPGSAMPVPQIAAQIGTALSLSADGATELALSPEELGHVRLRMEPDAANPDRMVVMISFERPETLDLFRRHAGELADALRAAGYAGVDIGFGQEGSGHGRSDRGSAHRAEPKLHDIAQTHLPPQLRAAGASLDLRL